jgi:hypothetical protein
MTSLRKRKEEYMKLTIESLFSQAQETAGMNNWGRDESFKVGLGVLVDSANAGVLPDGAIKALEQQILNVLVTRLRFVDDETKHPEILDQEIKRPLILTGLPRTGTTILHDLCALDPAGRAPLEWESSNPWPAPEVATYTTDPRIATTQARIDGMLAAMPMLRTMHPWGATLPADCLSFFALSFVCSRFAASFTVPEYSNWLANASPSGVYQMHKRALQQLQWRGPNGRWILKEPQHLLDLNQLIDVYPDACIVQTHRDPVRTIVSAASLIWTIQSILNPKVDKKATGQQVLELFGAHLERGVTARTDKDVDSRIIDIAYSDTVTDPVGTVQRIYTHFDLPFSDEHAHRIEHHMAENQQGKHGVHKYSAEDFGLCPDELMQLMPTYRDRFADLLTEPTR